MADTKPITRITITDKETGTETEVDVATCARGVVCDEGKTVQDHIADFVAHEKDVNRHVLVQAGGEEPATGPALWFAENGLLNYKDKDGKKTTIHPITQADAVTVPKATGTALGVEGETPNLDDALQKVAANIKELQAHGTVRHDVAQELTPEAKARARENIGAAAKLSEIDGGAVMYDTEQKLDTAQQKRARDNVGAVSAEDVSTAITTAINAALGDYATAMKALDNVVGMPATPEASDGGETTE